MRWRTARKERERERVRTREKENAKERSSGGRGREKKDAFLTHALCVSASSAVAAQLRNDFRAKRRFRSFCPAKINATARLSFGSDKSTNNAYGNYAAVVREKIYVLIHRKEINFSSLDVTFKTIDRAEFCI